jgi:hypothetical protein
MSTMYVRRRLVACLTTSFVLAVVPALAAQEMLPGPAVDVDLRAASTAPPLPLAVSAASPQPGGYPSAAGRPSILTPLYIGFAALQAIDVHSTFRALNHGGRESNPIVARMIDAPAGLVALKAGTSAGIILVSEKLWKRNRAAAVITMLVLNAAYAGVVTHNYSVRSGRTGE